ncbi:MAG: NYN domain-containing protein [Nocardiaceae bacterium]|nr:NYN domain-containing protein [Nocardiaceae bacterium]
MRSHCAVYIDAGYLLAAAATRITGTSLRGGIDVNHERLISALAEHAEKNSGLPLLRVHWYDSARNGVPDPTQQSIGLLPRVKIRLGRIGYDGEQKGVDLRIGLDLVAHARNGAVEAIYLVSGDDDLTEAVEEAQAHGVQVTVLAIPNADGEPHGVSQYLQRAADGLDLFESTAVDAAVTKKIAPPVLPPPPPITSTGPTPATIMKRVAEAARAVAASPAIPQTPTPAPRPAPVPVYSSTTGQAPVGPAAFQYTNLEEKINKVCGQVLNSWKASATADERLALSTGKPSIPREIDRALLHDMSEALGVYDLDDDIRHQLRAMFWAHVDS